MAGQEFRKFFGEGFHYFHKWWNWISTTMLILFLLSGFFFLVALVVDANQHSKETLEFKDRNSSKLFLLSNSCFSIASVISIFYLGSLCQVNSVFGPLQLSTLRMIKDILKFLTIFLGVFLSFTLGMRNLYSYTPNTLRNTTIIYSQHKLGSFWNATETMFWALFDQTDLEQFELKMGGGFEIITETGKFLFGLFLIIAVLVGINMLIAMMNNSYEYITKDENSKNWKLSRTSLWLEYIGKTSYHLPPPYNLIQLPFCAYAYCKQKLCKEVEQSNSKMMFEGDNEREEILSSLIHRYLENSKRNIQLDDLEETQAKLLQSLKEYSKREDKNPIYESNV